MASSRDRSWRLTLLEGEEILYHIDRHWLSGVTTLVIPVSILLIALGLFIYTAVGGALEVQYPGPRFQIDLVGWLFMALVAFIGALWVLMGVVDSDGYHSRRWGLLAMGLVVVVILSFRVAGGELFRVDTGQFNLFKPTALVLLVVTLVASIVVFYLLVDLLADKLILTNMRVIYYNGAILIPRLIEKQVQQDIMLEDIQNIVSRTETYLQHWFNYSNITVTAANAGQPINFRAANEAKEMQRRIFTARREMLARQGARNFTQLINARVYDDKVDKTPYSYPFPVLKMPFFARRVLVDNPVVDVGQGTVTWYPHWIFLARALLWPLLVFLAILVPLVFIVAAWVATGWLILIGLIALIACVLWAAYEIEDYRNDQYIVTSSTIVDVEKRPFGPESRRSAGLGTIQTVNYKTTFLSNILGYGDVLVKTAGSGGAFTFKRVPRPREVAATINQHISAYRRGDRDRALDESLSLLRQFHNYQGQFGELKPKGEAEG